MIRSAAVLALALGAGLAACDRAPRNACEVHRTAAAAVTTPDFTDSAEAFAFGPTCGQAVLTLVIRTQDGAPLAAFAAPYAEIAGGGAGAASPTEEELAALLDRWIALKPDLAANAPAWPAGAPGPQDPVMAVTTPLDREAYLALRAGGGPRVCVSTGRTEVRCLVYDQTQGRLIEQLTLSGAAPS